MKDPVLPQRHGGPVPPSVARVAWLIALLYFVALGTAMAQDAVTSSDITPTLKVTSRLVVLDVVVTDRSGRVRKDLKREDFTLYEDGAPQTIRNFDAPSARPSIPEAPVKDHNGRDDWGDSPLTMIVVDEMDTPFMEMAYARECVQRYLKKQPAQLTEPTLLLWLNDRGLHPLTGFTRNRDAVMDALQKQPPSNASMLARGAAVEQIAAAFAALQQAALFSRGESGKKEIIWVGRSFPAINPLGMDSGQEELLANALHSTVDMLLASRVTLYVVDPTLNSSSVAAEVGPGPADDSAMQAFDAPKIIDPFSRAFDINLFVTQTGGKYYRGLNDLDRQIGESVELGPNFYTLSYVPGPHDAAPNYRQIKVRVNNPDLIVQAKQGYYPASSDVPAPSKDVAKQTENDLHFDLYEASVVGMQYTGLGLRVERCQQEPDKIKSSCKIRIDTGTLTFSPSGAGSERTTILAVVSSLDAKSKMLNHSVQRITFSVPDRQASLIRTGASELMLSTVVPAGTKIVRVVVRDESGRIGTANVDADIVQSLITSVKSTTKHK